MTKAEFPHQVQAILHRFFNADRLGVGGHDLGDPGGPGQPSGGHDAVHNIAFGKDAHQLAIAQNGQRADAMLHHEARAFQNAAVSFDRINPAILYEVINRRHGRLLSASVGRPSLGGKGHHSTTYAVWYLSFVRVSGRIKRQPGKAAAGTAPASLLETESRSKGYLKVIMSAVIKIDFVTRLQPQSDGSPEALNPAAGIHGEPCVPGLDRAQGPDKARGGILIGHSEVDEPKFARYI